MDTGAEVNSIPISIADKLQIPLNIQINEFLLVDYNNNKITVFGTVIVDVIDRGKCEPLLWV